MAEPLLDVLHPHAVMAEKRRAVMAEVAEADVAKAVLLKQCPEVRCDQIRADDLAVFVDAEV